MSSQDELQKYFMNHEIQDKAGLLDSFADNKKRFEFWNEFAKALIKFEGDCPRNKVDDELYNRIKEVVGLRSIELVKILSSLRDSPPRGVKTKM